MPITRGPSAIVEPLVNRHARCRDYAIRFGLYVCLSVCLQKFQLSFDKTCHVDSLKVSLELIDFLPKHFGSNRSITVWVQILPPSPKKLFSQ